MIAIQQPAPDISLKKAEVANPVISLTSIDTIRRLPSAAILIDILRELRDDCAARAKFYWCRRRVWQAVYWKAAGVYAGHIARAIGPVPDITIGRVHANSPKPFGHTVNPITETPAFGRLRLMPLPLRIAFRSLLNEFGADASARANHSWSKHKSPMAAYFSRASLLARHLARALR